MRLSKSQVAIAALLAGMTSGVCYAQTAGSQSPAGQSPAGQSSAGQTAGPQIVGPQIVGPQIVGPQTSSGTPAASGGPATSGTSAPTASVPAANPPPSASTSAAGVKPVGRDVPWTQAKTEDTVSRPAADARRTTGRTTATSAQVTTSVAEHPTWGRLEFVLHGNPPPAVRRIADGIELTFAAGTKLRNPEPGRLREVASIETAQENGTLVARIHMSCNCMPDQQTSGGTLLLDFRPKPGQLPGPLPGQSAGQGQGPADGSRQGADIATSASNSADLSSLREMLTAKLAGLNGVAPPRPEGPPPEAAHSEPKPQEVARAPAKRPVRIVSDAAASMPGPASAPAAPALPAAPKAGGSATTASTGASPVASASIPASPTAAANPAATSNGAGTGANGAGTNGDAAATAPPVPVRDVTASQSTVCVGPLDASGWRGPDDFDMRLVTLRGQLAKSRGSASDMARLAEFYLANGLGHEALAIATDALDAAAGYDDQIRLSRDADIARLLKGEQLGPDSPLLATPPGCQRPDVSLWRALAAAAARDADGAARDAETVAAILRMLPDPLTRGLAFRIVSGVGNNLPALEAMAGSLRNTTDEMPEDEARRFLLQARVAAIGGDQSDYVTFLEHAARFDRNVSGMVARERLAAVRAAGDGASATRGEEILADIARTYRHEVLGQQAAEQYAELLLRRHEYATALQIADDSAGPHGGEKTESRGAALAGRILRMLFVEPNTAALPNAAERIALFLRYGGYVTPGDKGDDVRLAAARTMIDLGLAHPALDTLQQLSDAAAAAPEVAMLRASAEATGGDPAKALELAKGLPDGIDVRRLAAKASDRINKPLQGAHALDGATAFEDRARRADLLFEGEAWKDSAAAYSDLLGDPAITAEQRTDMARRYALAVAMTGDPPPPPPSVKIPDASARLLAAIAAPSRPVPSGSAALDPAIVRGALERSKSIENLLGPPPDHKGS